MNATVGMIYPTPVRSIGAGWANAVGRAGALAAPTIGGTLLAWHVSTQELLLAPAAVLSVGALCCAVLAVLCVRRYGGAQLAETAALTAALTRRNDYPAPAAAVRPAKELAPP